MLLRKLLSGLGMSTFLEPLKMLKEDSNVAWSAFSPDGALLAVAGDQLAVWDLLSLKKIVALPLNNPVADSRVIAWGASNLLAVADEAGNRIQILDCNKEFQITKVLEFDNTGQISDFAFNADGSRLLVTQKGIDLDADVPNAVVFDTHRWDTISLRTELSNEAAAWIGEDVVIAGQSTLNGCFGSARFNPRGPATPEPSGVMPTGISGARMLIHPEKNLIIVSSYGQYGSDLTRVRFIDATSLNVVKVIDVPGRLGLGMQFAGGHLVLCLTKPHQQVIKLLDIATGVFHNKIFNCPFASGISVSFDGTQLALVHQKSIFTYRLKPSMP